MCNFIKLSADHYFFIITVFIFGLAGCGQLDSQSKRVSEDTGVSDAEERSKADQMADPGPSDVSTDASESNESLNTAAGDSSKDGNQEPGDTTSRNNSRTDTDDARGQDEDTVTADDGNSEFELEGKDYPVKLRCSTSAFRPDRTDDRRGYQIKVLDLGEQGLVAELRKEKLFEKGASPLDRRVGRIDLLTLTEDISFTVGGIEIDVQGTRIEGVFEGSVSTPEGRELSATCWRPNIDLPYRYDAKTGHCLNSEGTEGFNELSITFVRETHRGQCADLSGKTLPSMGYIVLREWDLRGADLSGGFLQFADLLDAKLQGTDLKNFSLGYASLTGNVDRFTTLPDGSTPEGNEIALHR